jgi:hypothetical protein
VAKKSWCVPKLTDEFRERMENVLTLYERPHDPAEPVVCLDEQPYQLLDHVRPRTAAGPGQLAKQDHEYRRCETCNVFVAVEPAAGRRYVWVRRRRTKPDFARVVSALVRRYPRAKRIHLVLDNLNTHTPQSLVEALGSAQSARVLKRLVWHYTPKHASWLNMAEIEISVFTKQCLDRRLNAMERVESEASVWVRDRNRRRVPIRWTFRHADARRVFPELYRKKLAG